MRSDYDEFWNVPDSNRCSDFDFDRNAGIYRNICKAGLALFVGWVVYLAFWVVSAGLGMVQQDPLSFAGEWDLFPDWFVICVDLIGFGIWVFISAALLKAVCGLSRKLLHVNPTYPGMPRGVRTVLRVLSVAWMLVHVLIFAMVFYYMGAMVYEFASMADFVSPGIETIMTCLILPLAFVPSALICAFFAAAAGLSYPLAMLVFRWLYRVWHDAFGSRDLIS